MIATTPAADLGTRPDATMPATDVHAAPVHLDADEELPDQLTDRVCSNPRAAGALLELLQRLDAVELADDGRPAEATASRVTSATTSKAAG